MVPDLKEILAVLVVSGAFVFVVGGIGGVWIGLVLARLRSPQEAVLRRELMATCKGYERQIDAAADAVSRLVVDPRTAPHDQLALSDHVVPLLRRRARAD